MEDRNNDNNEPPINLTRLIRYAKRRIKLNRFLLVIDTKKGVVISAFTVIIVDLIDLLWNLSMTFGPLNSTMTMLLLLETILVICVCCVLLWTMKKENKSDLRSVLLIWLVVVAIDYLLRVTLAFSALIISEKASTTAKVMKSSASIVMFVLVAHCWLCVFTYYDDNNGKISLYRRQSLPNSAAHRGASTRSHYVLLTQQRSSHLTPHPKSISNFNEQQQQPRAATVKITPSDDKGRTQFNKRQMIMMKPSAASAINAQELSAANLERDAGAATGANMLRAPTEDAQKSRW